MAVIKQISLQQLKVGMYVTQVDAEWAASINVRDQGLITRQATIELFRQHGMTECYIDTLTADAASPARGPRQFPHCDEDFPTPAKSYEAERDNALEVRAQALMMVSVKMGAGDGGLPSAAGEAPGQADLRQQEPAVYEWPDGESGRNGSVRHHQKRGRAVAIWSERPGLFVSL